MCTSCRWGTNGTCCICCRSCLVCAVYSAKEHCRPQSTTSIWVKYIWVYQTVWRTYGLYLWPWVGDTYVTTFHMTFLSVTHHIRTYILCENRSSIQSISLMRSATSSPVEFCQNDSAHTHVSIYLFLYLPISHSSFRPTHWNSHVSSHWSPQTVYYKIELNKPYMLVPLLLGSLLLERIGSECYKSHGQKCTYGRIFLVPACRIHWTVSSDV